VSLAIRRSITVGAISNRDRQRRLQAIAFVALILSFASLAFSQQAAPSAVLPPTPQKPPVSPTLATITPAGVSGSAVNPTTVTPQAPAAPQQSKPDLPQPATVGTNTLPAATTGQPLPSGSTQPSPWDRTNAVQSSVWDKTSAAKTTTDPWSSPPPNARAWDSTTPLNSSGTKTEWK